MSAVALFLIEIIHIYPENRSDVSSICNEEQFITLEIRRIFESPDHRTLSFAIEKTTNVVIKLFALTRASAAVDTRICAIFAMRYI